MIKKYILNFLFLFFTNTLAISATSWNFNSWSGQTYDASTVTLQGNIFNQPNKLLQLDIDGNIPISNISGGVGASSQTYLRGDNQWAFINSSSGSPVNLAPIYETISSTRSELLILISTTNENSYDQVLSTWTNLNYRVSSNEYDISRTSVIIFNENYYNRLEPLSLGRMAYSTGSKSLYISSSVTNGAWMPIWSPPYQEGLIAWYKMDGDANDSINNYNGTLLRNNFAKSQYNSGLAFEGNFDGNNNYFYNESLPKNLTNLTIIFKFAQLTKKADQSLLNFQTRNETYFNRRKNGISVDLDSDWLYVFLGDGVNGYTFYATDASSFTYTQTPSGGSGLYTNGLLMDKNDFFTIAIVFDGSLPNNEKFSVYIDVPWKSSPIILKGAETNLTSIASNADLVGLNCWRSPFNIQYSYSDAIFDDLLIYDKSLSYQQIMQFFSRYR